MISYQTESHLAGFILKGWSIFSVYNSQRFNFSDQMYLFHLTVTSIMFKTGDFYIYDDCTYTTNRMTRLCHHYQTFNAIILAHIVILSIRLGPTYD